MKLPIPLLLYTVSLGLLGWVGWQVYQTLPSWKDKAREAATLRGQQDAKDRIAGGQGQNTFAADWIYSQSAAPWWASFKNVNLIGKLPPPPPVPNKPDENTPPPSLDLRPLEDVIELVSLVYDGEQGGRGGNTHVIVRYKQEANVEPPEWYVREHTPPAAAAGLAANMPRDAVRSTGVPPGRPANAAPQPPPVTPAPNRGGGRPPTPMPTSMTGSPILQSVWVDDHGDMRHSATLWPVRSNDGKVFGTIKLVRVAPDAQTAYFVRVLPPAAAEQTPPEPKEERLLKTTMNLRQDVIEELRRLQGRAGPAGEPAAASPAPASTTWQDVAETSRVGKAWQVSRKDEQRFRENPEQLFEQISVDTYVGRSGAVRGVSVRSVDPQIAQRFGVAAGEVLIEVNGRTVESKAQAMKFGESDYRRGVRTFVTKWLSNGQVVERIYQAPDR